MNQNEHIDEQLLLQYLLGTCDTESKGEIEEWLKKSEANRKHLERLEALWLETGKLVPPPVAVDTAAAWQRLSGRIDALEKEQHRQGNRIIPMQTLAWVSGIAAVVLVAFGFWWFGLFSPEEDLQVIASMEEVVKDTLPDGSLVTLNKNSSLVYPAEFESGKREVSLQGEAFFRVKPDPANPFIIQAGRAGIQVMGTSFDVRAYPDKGVEVIVSTGRVVLFHLDPQTGDSAGIILTAGMKGLLLPGTGKPVVESGYTPDDLFWMDQTLEFRQTPLSVVIELLSKYYHTKIRLSSESISNCRLTASFTGDSIELILQVIADTFSLELEQTNGTYLLTGNDCGEANR